MGVALAYSIFDHVGQEKHFELVIDFINTILLHLCSKFMAISVTRVPGTILTSR